MPRSRTRNPLRPTEPTPRPPKANLTATQTFILAHARDNGGIFSMRRGDRMGTRIAGKDDFGRLSFIAYCTPEYFLAGRGLIEAYGNSPHTYRITAKGLELISTRPAPEIKRTKCDRLGWGAGQREAARQHHGRKA